MEKKKDILKRFPSAIGISQETVYCGYGDTEQKLEDMIVLLLHGLLEPDEEEAMWKHVETCEHCVNKANLIIRSLEVMEREWQMPYEEVRNLIKSKDKVRLLTTVIEELSKQHSLKELLEGVTEFINKVFSFPLPQLSPFFGESEIDVIEVLSPFGKVRYPIVFEWNTVTAVKEFLIKVGGREFSTTSTRLELEKDIMPLNYGEEYEWEILMIDRSGKAIEGPIGYYALCTVEEERSLSLIDKEIMGMDLPEETVNTLCGVVLEKKGFFVEAIERYKKAYGISKSADLVVRIAACYEELGLNDLREEWKNRL